MPADVVAFTILACRRVTQLAQRANDGFYIDDVTAIGALIAAMTRLPGTGILLRMTSESSGSIRGYQSSRDLVFTRDE